MPKSENIKITTTAGIELAARLDHAAGAHRGWAIFAHCFTCSKDSLAASRVSTELAMEGISVLRMDFTGLGQSSGDFAESSFTSNLEDIAAAAAWLEEYFQAPEILIGHSLGGAAVLAAASGLESIKGIATIGAPADPQHVQHLFAKHLDQIEKDGFAEVQIGARPIRVGQKFIDDLTQHDAPKTIATLHADLLVMHAPSDQIVGIDNAAAIYSAAKHPKSFVSLDRADHLLSKREDSLFAAKMISAWAARCLGHTKLGSADGVIVPDAGDGALTVQSSPDGIFAHDIQTGLHRMRADEPPSFPGGKDSGPAPYDFLKAGLGACTAITIRMVAERRKYALDECRVIVRHHKQGDGPAAHDVFTRELILEGDLDDEARQFLLGIANKCPVHKTLEASADVTTVLKD